MTNLQIRILAGAIYFPVLLLSAYDPTFFALFMTICLGLSWYEYMRFRDRPKDNRAHAILVGRIVIACLPPLFLGAHLSMELAIGVYALILEGYVIHAIFKGKPIANIKTELSYEMLGYLYLTGLFSLLVLVRWRSSGPEPLWFLFFVVALTDTCAYFTGKKYGKTPFFPTISPSKTWEGVYGGLGGAVVISIVLYFVLRHYDYETPNLFLCILLAAVLAAVSIFGDLFESLLKRTYGVKDSGTLIPGHGGILDRLDALLFAGAPLFFFVILRGGFR